MAWDLPTARTYTGQTDNSKDAILKQCMDITLRGVELVLQRCLLRRREKVVFRDVRGRTLLLPRYPLKKVYSVGGADNTNPISVNWEPNCSNGWIQFCYPVYTETDILVDYEGGYQTYGLPAELERVMWEIFLDVWANTDQTTGAPVGGGSSVITGSGDVSRVTLTDFGTVTYDVGTTTTGGDDTALASQQALYGWLSPWAATLNMFRSQAGVGLGFA